MSEQVSEFENRGCTVVGSVLSDGELESAAQFCGSVHPRGVGTRQLLSLRWCADLARSIREKGAICALLGSSRTAVQCTLFVKDARRNWLVPLHRDFSIPVKARVASLDWSAWSVKEGVIYGRPPEFILQSLVAVRVHLDDTDAENGALQVVLGSHRPSQCTGARHTHVVPKGGALVMRPLLLHASSKLTTGTRRVLHFVYGPAQLPDAAEWANAV
ncbi:MAG TPA: phytanoyl-CoA dioxygenase family protein [Candidatus Binatia bacterium]|jgi:hypothetical protein|nr:phytanoyl-CoA dioxygenase family protein [Candidatus Binatia bacterium]